MAIATYTFPAVTVAFPPGLATAANQVTQIGLETTMDASLASIDTKLTGVSTAANQVTGNSSLSSIDTKLSSQATAANQATGNASLASIDSKLTAPLSVTGPLTDTQLRASAVPVSVSSSALPTGAATSANQATEIASLSSIDTKVTRLTVVDQIDTTPLLDVSVTNIPASASAPVQVVASLAAQVYKVISVEDIGEFIGLYTGAASSEVLAAVLPLGGGEVEVSIPAGTRISLRNMKNAAIVSDFIAINFLG